MSAYGIAVTLVAVSTMPLPPANIRQPLTEFMLPAFLDAYEAKYDYRPQAEQTDGVYAVRPARVLAWREKDFPTSATRFAPSG